MGSGTRAAMPLRPTPRRHDVLRSGSHTMDVQTTGAKEGKTVSKYDRLIDAAKAIPPTPTIVVHPCDESSLRGVVEAARAGLINPVLVGPAAKIRNAASEHGLDIEGYEVVEAPHSEAAAALAV